MHFVKYVYNLTKFSTKNDVGFIRVKTFVKKIKTLNTEILTKMI